MVFGFACVGHRYRTTTRRLGGRCTEPVRRPGNTKNAAEKTKPLKEASRGRGRRSNNKKRMQRGGGGGQDLEALEREVLSPFSMFHQGHRVVVLSALELLGQALHSAAEKVFRPLLGNRWEQGVITILWDVKSPAERARHEKPSTLDLLQLLKGKERGQLPRFPQQGRGS